MFWGSVFAFLYLRYVYDRAIDILEFWKRVTTGSKVLTIWGNSRCWRTCLNWCVTVQTALSLT